jgi:hypothetical protein
MVGLTARRTLGELARRLTKGAEMGILRKGLFLGTGGMSGVAGVRANSKKERIAKALEKQNREAARQAAPPAAKGFRAGFESKVRPVPATTITAAEDQRLLGLVKDGWPPKGVLTGQEINRVSHLLRAQEDNLPVAAKIEPKVSTVQLVDQLAKAGELHRKGDITDEEFATIKDRLMNEATPTADPVPSPAPPKRVRPTKEEKQAAHDQQLLRDADLGWRSGRVLTSQGKRRVAELRQAQEALALDLAPPPSPSPLPPPPDATVPASSVPQKNRLTKFVANVVREGEGLPLIVDDPPPPPPPPATTGTTPPS